MQSSFILLVLALENAPILFIIEATFSEEHFVILMLIDSLTRHRTSQYELNISEGLTEQN